MFFIPVSEKNNNVDSDDQKNAEYRLWLMSRPTQLKHITVDTFFVPAVFTRWRHLVSFAVSPDLFTDVQESMIERQNTANEKKPPHGLDDPKI